MWFTQAYLTTGTLPHCDPTHLDGQVVLPFPREWFHHYHYHLTTGTGQVDMPACVPGQTDLWWTTLCPYPGTPPPPPLHFHRHHHPPTGPCLLLPWEVEEAHRMAAQPACLHSIALPHTVLPVPCLPVYLPIMPVRLVSPTLLLWPVPRLPACHRSLHARLTQACRFHHHPTACLQTFCYLACHPGPDCCGRLCLWTCPHRDLPAAVCLTTCTQAFWKDTCCTVTYLPVLTPGLCPPSTCHHPSPNHHHPASGQAGRTTQPQHYATIVSGQTQFETGTSLVAEHTDTSPMCHHATTTTTTTALPMGLPIAKMTTGLGQLPPAPTLPPPYRLQYGPPPAAFWLPQFQDIAPPNPHPIPPPQPLACLMV